MSEDVLAPLSGKIVSIEIQAGTAVEEDDEILVIEAMKMETPSLPPVPAPWPRSRSKREIPWKRTIFWR